MAGRKDEKENKKIKGKPKKSPKERLGEFPSVSHTKGYYRFSKEFPSADSEGFRDNRAIKERDSNKSAFRRKLAVTFAVVFVIGFVCGAVAFSVSRLPAEVGENETYSWQTEGTTESATEDSTEEQTQNI